MVETTQEVRYRDLREYLQLLEAAGLLKRIHAEVDLKHELGAICATAMDKGLPHALSFENIKGYPGKSIVSNIMFSMEELAIIFNAEPDSETLYSIAVEGMRNRVPSLVVETGPCKEETHFGDDVDLFEMPTPWWHEKDGGQYLGTQAGVITRDPETGTLNMGTFRCMIIDKSTLTLSGQIIGRNRDVAKNDANGLPTPVALALGMDPLLTLASGTKVPAEANGFMEYEAAGAWRGVASELVKCETSDLLVPARAEVIIEGEIPHDVTVPEGPHGESTGFYQGHPAARMIKVKAITHRRDPIIYGLICRQTEDYPRWLMRAGSFAERLADQSGFDNIREVFFPEWGGWTGGQGFMIIAAEIRSPDEPKRIIEESWKLTPHKWVILVDEDCDVPDIDEVMWRVHTSVDGKRDVIIRDAGKAEPVAVEGEPRRFEPPGHPLGMNASFKFKNMPDLPLNLISKELKTRVRGRWKELGLI